MFVFLKRDSHPLRATKLKISNSYGKWLEQNDEQQLFTCLIGRKEETQILKLLLSEGLEEPNMTRVRASATLKLRLWWRFRLLVPLHPSVLTFLLFVRSRCSTSTLRTWMCEHSVCWCWLFVVLLSERQCCCEASKLDCNRSQVDFQDSSRGPNGKSKSKNIPKINRVLHLLMKLESFVFLT